MPTPLRISPKLVTVDRASFMLTLWQLNSMNNYRRVLHRQIALGQEGHETPPGLYFVDGKNRRPAWLVPNSEWAPKEMRGTVIPFESPQNPFAGGFISLNGGEGIGIHGTKFDPQLGTNASHGCVRMDVKDFDKLYPKIPVGTPVFIFN
jgi:lipoprotein-anchoring transpeptidase ErfK/SrfK